MKINSFSVGSAPNHNEDFLEYVNMGIDGYFSAFFYAKQCENDDFLCFSFSIL